ncbi:hypothetical protein BJF93_10445 [Xaviernesmea oryzae]|uniref:Biotin biosynthesis protein BioC n=1 Tax=Xaviernesmea oryzae TaxID=464029 RepID=A0A1Q9AX06_9HYPH|nr:hypothetical protein [Xaviernesmea oryzae]OLP59992.1 hypothetical protein BJF93_10445 [Xaviernesmea oryzae]SEK41369.1 hypothetical protein SAMN04487976_102123 [Xaviernesmea oryzae]
MQVDSKSNPGQTGGNKNARQVRVVETAEEARPAPKVEISSMGKGFDPSSRVVLSAEAMLFLSYGNKRTSTSEKYPPLTKDEWANKLSPQLAQREYQAFGRHSETGDYKAYYRGFIDYYDNLRPEDQNSLRYFGTRDAAVAGLRSMDYSDGMDSGSKVFTTLVSALLDGEKPEMEIAQRTTTNMIAGDMFGWEAPAFSYDDGSERRGPLSEIEKFYNEDF